MWRDVWRISTVGLEMGLSIGLSVWLGLKADAWLGTHFLVFLGLAVGIGAAVKAVLRAMRDIQRSNK